MTFWNRRDWPRPKQMHSFCNKVNFYSEELSPRPTPKLEDNLLSAVSDCLFNVHHGMVTGTHLSWNDHSMLGKNALCKLLMGNFSLCERGHFWTPHHLKYIHLRMLNIHTVLE